MMMKRLFSAVVSTCVACAIVSSAFALAGFQEAAVTKTTPPLAQAAPAAKTPEGKPPKVKVYKSAPRPNGAGAAAEKRLAAIKQKAERVQKRARAAAPVAFAMNLDGQVQQMMMQFRPIIRAEFHVILRGLSAHARTTQGHRPGRRADAPRYDQKIRRVDAPAHDHGPARPTSRGG